MNIIETRFSRRGLNMEILTCKRGALQYFAMKGRSGSKSLRCIFRALLESLRRLSASLP
jgi:hypothetical protein